MLEDGEKNMLEDEKKKMLEDEKKKTKFYSVLKMKREEDVGRSQLN